MEILPKGPPTFETGHSALKTILSWKAELQWWRVPQEYLVFEWEL